MKLFSNHIKVVVLVVTVFMVSFALIAFGGEPDRNSHQEKASCEDCHLKDSEGAIPTTDQCLSCHGSYQELAEKTEKIEYGNKGLTNPHKSHIGEVRCTLCHKNHEPSVLYCNTCHLPKFDLKVP